MRGMGIRPPPAGPAGTRGTSRPILTRRSSPLRWPRRETAGTPRSLSGCSRTCSPAIRQDAAAGDSGQAAAPAAGEGQPAVYGDAGCGSGELIAQLDGAGIYNGSKCQPPAAVKDHFPKDRFTIDLDGKTVTCTAGVTVPIRPAAGRHAGAARFAAACRTCPLAARCTTATEGRTITIGPHEAQLAAARVRQADPARKADYRAKVERKISHLMRRRHGGRRARLRGLVKVTAGFALPAAAVNLARLGVPGGAYRNGAWRPAAADNRNGRPAEASPARSRPPARHLGPARKPERNAHGNDPGDI